jgi:hypothetical protein
MSAWQLGMETGWHFADWEDFCFFSHFWEGCLNRLSRKNGDGTIQMVDWISLARSFTSCTHQTMGGYLLFPARVQCFGGYLILQCFSLVIHEVVCQTPPALIAFTLRKYFQSGLLAGFKMME